VEIERIVSEAMLLLDDGDEYERMSRAHNPYGDGYAAMRIVKILSDSQDEKFLNEFMK
jgi:UDP-N-acetylglucosamine 2-epimerase (non-hydrolysing)